uniref:DNA replication licensing factor MCM2 n=1 Tax=Chlamydomonas leiostraca TaxID=1034604 RepID=A0A7S0WTV5_9CHLO|mmetsp:Transcript_28578/g.72713  ORF Transcript_28578/g.72713 Transcript_28578/m.72713 type:complete len:882 (+) Transcript_28578:62-2707(+)|eukprot:CAMPEP_0202863480 /NCGR_PEP_ID=MMETSP1391-20130828/4106_1 /ASSEMBLY_ACC=CAM_ASM_000867 /TAXON_ID=1034604 /ORGANISM="Chlamydomonas leiostraca, Strain SAG 11-49" /LENGTH=881 /DNA_ID=CAMNT_0049543125 /DNA_START=62 /DNA_END=2707 /DNA_ORIENTATION=-
MADNELDHLEPVEDEQDEERLQDDEEEEGEDLLENMEQDYRSMDHLDNYEADGVDDDVEEELDEEGQLAARAAAEAELNRRDRKQGKRGARGMPGFLAGDETEDDDFASRRARRQRRPDMSLPEQSEPEDVPINIEEHRGRLQDWIAQEQVSREVKRRFRNFLKSYREDAGDAAQADGAAPTPPLYVSAIRDMMSAGRRSLEVRYGHLSKSEAILSMWLADAPKLMLDLFSQAAREVVLGMFEGEDEVAAAVGNSEFEVHVRISELPVQDRLRDLRGYHLNGLVRVSGVVTRRTGVFPQLRVVKFDCAKCGYLLGPFTQAGDCEIKPQLCPNCSSKGPFMVNAAETVYRDYQKITLQESPGTVPAGRLPRHKEVILTHDLIDCARPGEEVDVTGVFVYGYDASLNVRNSFPVFSTHIEANYISKREDAYSIYALTDEDKAAILGLSRDPRIGQRIIKSIAPSIYGHEFIKTGLAMALFGGMEKHPSPAYRLRGDINMLLLGDPGVAKSQFLKYVEKTAVRAVYTTGKGASAVGLTAAVHKDPLTREWTLEGGALVLADKGVCLIDEFDKMNDQDRVSIHEAMEQQSISISKAGIVTQLQARCSVIAAANPVGGRYDPARTFAENVELSDPILSRFDVLAVVRDQVDPVQDQRLAEFVVGSHARNHPTRRAAEDEGEEVGEASIFQDPAADPDVLPQDLLKKYITYAKQHCRPQLQQADYDRIQRVYTELRKAAAASHGMPIAVRHLESLIRMSEAHAKMHLRSYVADDDINAAIRQLVGSFIQTQKYSVHKTLERRFRAFLTHGSDYHQLLMSLLRGLLSDAQRAARLMGDAASSYKIPLRSLEARAQEHEVTDIKGFLESPLFSSSGFRVDGGSVVIEAV